MKRVLTLIVAAVMITTAFGASAFTTGYADRTATINVVADDSGLIGLSDGNTGDLVGVDSTTGQLNIDFSNGSLASGANGDAYFEVGDPADGNVTYAFNITNNDNTAKTLNLNYTMDSDPDTSNQNVIFEVYTGSNTNILTAGEGSSVASSQDLGSGETVHVVIKVDTSNIDTSTTSKDLSGTLRVKLS